MDDDREYLPLSWLSQADYCLRRAALLLNERIWVENAETAKGRTEHERVHTQRIEHRGTSVKLYEYDVVSEKLGLSGKCDCIEAVFSESGCRIPAVDFPVSLYPIEYKHGTLRNESEYNLQLCAQAMALEEMYHTEIKEGAVFFISSHKRFSVTFDSGLRDRVCQTASLLRSVREKFIIPNARHSSKCLKCSLRDYCMPRLKLTARPYCSSLKEEAIGEIKL